MARADWGPLLAVAAGHAARFARACADPRAAQMALLHRIVQANRDTAFGRAHGFGPIASLADYQRAVPVAEYDAFAAAIARMAAGAANELVADPVIAFEETGGSASGGKLVPHTAAGLDGFAAAVLPWLGDLARRRPTIAAGRAYATISPATRAPRATASGLPIGLPSDAAYLGEAAAPAFAAVLAVPPGLAGVTDVKAWRIATLAALVQAEDLAFVSLWSPTFLSALLAELEPLAEAVLARIDPPARVRLDAALKGTALCTARLWPGLDCISCWADGASAAPARQLAACFPHAAIEAKGLLATEAAITVPWGAEEGGVPALHSALIEFFGADGQPRLCDELVPGETYALVLTTQSGLYRYAIGDRVECLSTRQGLPRLRFIGRDGLCSDLVGEKLTEAFVATALAGLPFPATLAPRGDGRGYVLHAECAAPPAGLAERIEQHLCANPHYAHARRMGQLAPLRLAANARLSARLIAAGLAGGRRMGDLKPVALLSRAVGDGADA